MGMSRFSSTSSTCAAGLEVEVVRGSNPNGDNYYSLSSFVVYLNHPPPGVVKLHLISRFTLERYPDFPISLVERFLLDFPISRFP